MKKKKKQPSNWKRNPLFCLSCGLKGSQLRAVFHSSTQLNWVLLQQFLQVWQAEALSPVEAGLWDLSEVWVCALIRISLWSNIQNFELRPWTQAWSLPLSPRVIVKDTPGLWANGLLAYLLSRWVRHAWKYVSHFEINEYLSAIVISIGWLLFFFLRKQKLF